MRRRILLLVLLVAAGCTEATSSAAPVPTPAASIQTPASQTPASPSDPSPSPAGPAPPVYAPEHAPWADAIDAAIGGRDVSVTVGLDHRIVYRYRGSTPRVLASNEKLLTSMAALDLLGPTYRFRTIAATDARVRDGVIRGDLWLIGGGDPSLSTSDLASLAGRLAATGIRRVRGRVVGDTAAFDRGWWAPGWLRGISRQFVDRPTALRLEASSGLEAGAAAAFRSALLGAGVDVGGDAATGVAPGGVQPLAADRSATLGTLLAHQNHESDNLYAELTTKLLGDSADTPGSTASGAQVIHRWALERGVDASVRDGSGLSDQDRTSADDMVALLLQAQRRPWFPVFFRSLPAGGEGTLSGRLVGLPVRAKTGTLFVRPTSTLSGYVTLQNGRTVAFSVLTHDLPEATAVGIEDAVVRALAGATIG